MNITITIANNEHTKHAETIAQYYEESAKKRGTGIAKRDPEYLKKKMRVQDAVIALDDSEEEDKVAGFCYIETWDHGKYISNSGLIVHPHYRGFGLGKKVKHKIFKYSRKKYPDAKIFGITTSPAVMKINTDLGYDPVPFSDLTREETFWDGCQSCPNYDILTRTDRTYCLCTGMLYEPEKNESKAKRASHKLLLKWENFKRFALLMKLKLQRKFNLFLKSQFGTQ